MDLLEHDHDQNGTTPTDDVGTRWEGYSDYKYVSYTYVKAIHEATEAYARLDSAHQEGSKIDPELAADARAMLLNAALKLIPELRADADTVDDYEDILDRWLGEGDDTGYVQQLNEVHLATECPGWLLQFTMDIQTAGWQLGYLQAGRTTLAEPEDPVERDTESMFQE